MEILFLFCVDTKILAISDYKEKIFFYLFIIGYFGLKMIIQIFEFKQTQISLMERQKV